MRRTRYLVLLGVLFIGGCHTGTLPNPNEPADMGGLSQENIHDQFTCFSEMLQARQARGEITSKEFSELLAKATAPLLVGFNLDKVDVSKANQMADILIQVKDWQDAKKVLEGSIVWAQLNRNEDRRVNDTLKLAHVQAEIADVPGAIKTARTVFNVRAEDAVPVLFETLYQIALLLKEKVTI